MSTRYETEFVEPGTLVRPSWIGRLVRLLLGVLLLRAFFDLVRSEIWMARGDTGLTSSRPPDDLVFWLLVAFVFWIFPHVVNIGFGVRWGRWPQLALLAVVGVTVGVSLLTAGSVWSPALGWVLLAWLLYVSLHLGVSFVLSAFLATPGCEMRSIPHLWTLASGRPTAEHYCPGFLDPLDRWETGRRAGGGSERGSSGDSSIGDSK